MKLVIMLLAYVTFLLLVVAFVHVGTRDEMPWPEPKATEPTSEPEPEA